jgi:DNA-binding beta-propeller fold protein YncE
MLWVDGGAIYALVDADVKEFAPSVDNALNITVAGGKVYWTEMTGESGVRRWHDPGTVNGANLNGTNFETLASTLSANSANLNGTGVTELASIFATPMGIAVDVTNSKLYWTNSAGRIQSANLDGSRITNELQNLASPMDIALAGGNAYWTQGGNVRFVNLRGQKVVRNVSTGMDTAGSLAIGGGKVYWTEMTGESGGTINSANLNGTGVTELASIFATPIGIAVDAAGSKLYWTNSAGRIQSANLDGSRITNELQNLASPMDIALAGGNAYWTQGGNVRFVNLRGQKVVRNVSTGMDTAGSLAIGGGKVYWTEMTGESGGTINSANLNGTGVTELASIVRRQVPLTVRISMARTSKRLPHS